MDKLVTSADEAVSGIASGMTIAVGGFGLCGIPSVLIDALVRHGASELEVVSNNCGVDDVGLGQLLRSRRIRRMIASYVRPSPNSWSWPGPKVLVDFRPSC
jgi:3-oxoacid CoA-transferase subunit A